MTKYVICDNCGEHDDWGRGRELGPFFPDGVLISFRDDNGGDALIADLELCAGCKALLIEAFPKLGERLAEIVE